MRSVESFRSSLAFMASLTALLISSRSIARLTGLVSPEGRVKVLYWETLDLSEDAASI
jgi:hypothetical protein